MDTVALHLVRLRDGRVCDRRVYRDDYVRLRGAAAVSVFAETASSCLVSVLSLRWQAFRVLRVVLGAPVAPADGAALERRRFRASGFGDTVSRVRARKRDRRLKTSSRRLRTRARRWGRSVRAGRRRAARRADGARRGGGWRRAPMRRSARRRRFRRAFALTPSEPASRDDDARLFFLLRRGTDPWRWPRARRVGRTRPARLRGDKSTGSRGRGWSDPESHMYAGIKQKLMTRVLLEARRRDVERRRRRRRAKGNGGRRRRGRLPPRDDPYDPSSSLSSRRGVQRDAAIRVRALRVGAAEVQANAWPRLGSAPEYGGFSGRRRSQLRLRARLGAARSSAPSSAGTGRTRSGWFCGTCSCSDERRALLRFGTAEHVLAWGTRRSRAEAGDAPGSERFQGPRWAPSWTGRWHRRARGRRRRIRRRAARGPERAGAFGLSKA